MAHEIPWDRRIFNEFVYNAMLSDQEAEILEERIKGSTIEESAERHSLSVGQVNMIISSLKQKYDRVQPFSEFLPVRKPKKKRKKFGEYHTI